MSNWWDNTNNWTGDRLSDLGEGLKDAGSHVLNEGLGPLPALNPNAEKAKGEGFLGGLKSDLGKASWAIGGPEVGAAAKGAITGITKVPGMISTAEKVGAATAPKAGVFLDNLSHSGGGLLKVGESAAARTGGVVGEVADAAEKAGGSLLKTGFKALNTKPAWALRGLAAGAGFGGGNDKGAASSKLSPYQFGLPISSPYIRG